jgi:hypothetical protein
MKKSRLLEIIREEISGVLKEVGQSPEEAKATNLAIQAKKAQILAAQKELQQLQKSGVSEVALEEDTLNEMAKITGRLETAIKKIIADNPELEGLPLKKVIRKDAEVIDSLEGDDLYDNQLNKFIALVKGEREVGQRGRKADPNKPKAEPKEPGVRGRKPMDSKPKDSTSDEPAEDKSTEDKGTEQKARKNDEIIKQYRDVISAYKKMKTEKGAQAATAYLKTKQNIVKKYKDIQQGKL